MPESLRPPCPTRYRMVFGGQQRFFELLGEKSSQTCCGTLLSEGRKEPVIRLWRHPLIDPIFRRLAVSTRLASGNLHLVTLPRQGPAAISPLFSCKVPCFYCTTLFGFCKPRPRCFFGFSSVSASDVRPLTSASACILPFSGECYSYSAWDRFSDGMLDASITMRL